MLNPACDDTPRKSCQVQSLTQQTGNSEDPCGSRDELGEFTGVSRTKQLEFCRVLGQQKTHLKIQGKDLHDLVSGCYHFLIHDPEAKAVWESHKRPGGRKLVKLCPCSQFLTPPVGISCYRATAGTRCYRASLQRSVQERWAGLQEPGPMPCYRTDSQMPAAPKVLCFLFPRCLG